MNQVRVNDVNPLLPDAQKMRDLLYRMGRRMMESRATGEPLNLRLLGQEIDELLYSAKKPQRFA